MNKNYSDYYFFVYQGITYNLKEKKHIKSRHFLNDLGKIWVDMEAAFQLEEAQRTQ